MAIVATESQALSADEQREEVAQDRWLGRASFRDFVEMAWPCIEPAQAFVPNWHIDAICDHLAAVTKSEIKELIINIPPGHSKSSICSVLWPAWCWVNNPSLKFITASYSERMASRDCLSMRELIASDWFSLRWGARYNESNAPNEDQDMADAVLIHRDRDTQTEYRTTRNGLRFGASVGTAPTGRHAHIQIIDDPVNAREVDYELARENSIRWIDGVMSTRWVDPKNQRRVVVMQRLHENDLTGHLLAKGTYDQLILPAEYEGNRCRTRLKFVDPRKNEGDLLNPQRFDANAIAQLKRNLGSYGTAGQLQQRPAPTGGGIVKSAWFKRWTQAALPPRFDNVEVCVDANFKDGKKADNTAIGVWGDLGPASYLLDMVPPRAMSYVDMKRVLLELAAKYTVDGRCSIRAWRIEAAANGHALISELKSVLAGVVPFNPAEFGSKVARTEASSPQIEAGNVWIPAQASWVDAYLGEMIAFPNGAHDDMVDMTTMHLLSRKSIARYEYTPVAKPTSGLRSRGVM